MTRFTKINCLTPDFHKFQIEYYVNPENVSSTILIHGFNDFHYNELLHDKIIANKSNVFLLTLRNYNGLQESEPQFYVNNLRKYFYEINETIEQISSLTLCKTIYLMGHSTGALTCIAYCHEGLYKEKINELILNSPFLDFYKSFSEELYLKTIGHVVGYFSPLRCLSKIDNSYPTWIDENVSKDLQTKEFIKVINSNHSVVNVSGKFYGWIYAVYKYQRLIQNNSIKLNIPVHVFFSNKSCKSSTGGDSILDVNKIRKYSLLLAKKKLIHHYVIKNGLHNVFSSNEIPRSQSFTFLDSIYKKIEPKG